MPRLHPAQRLRATTALVGLGLGLVAALAGAPAAAASFADPTAQTAR